MNHDLRLLLDTQRGVLSRADALAVVPHHVLDHAAGAHKLVRLHPGVYVDPEWLTEPHTRARAALRYCGPAAALSHVTALSVWRLPGGQPDGPVHILVPASVGRRRGGSGIVVHRRRGFTAEASGVTRSGMLTSRVEPTVVDAWPLLPADTRRAAVIAAVADRRTTPERIRAAVDANPNVPGRPELVRLVTLLELGCRSELEMWGYDHVFTGPDLPAIERDAPVRVGGRTIYLDVYCREARVNFELDGAKWHTSASDRGRDARRDAALAAMGIMVVRFTHDQLVGTPELVRTQIREIIAARLRGTVG